MKLIDYTGKLNDHNEYLKVMIQLEKKCKYIEYVLVDEDDTALIERFQAFIISQRLAKKWWGTKSSHKNKVYRIKATSEIFKYLKRFETFCKYTLTEYGDQAEDSDFGINDIAFFDEHDMPLLFTTTHEGYITIRNDLFR